jgi:flagellum-specific peptidoglycan hydrolase FlgJ
MNPIVQQFIQTMVPVAQDVQGNWSVPASVCIAQAALETGWGRFVVGNNYFGIKASVAGASAVNSPTWEFENGKWISTVASFSSYTSLTECADDYGRYLKTNPRFKECFNLCNVPLEFTEALQAAGYATDPSYAEKLNSIITSYDLVQYDVNK